MSKVTSQLAKVTRERVNSGEAKLPILPESVMKVRDIVNDEKRGAADIAKVIGDDPTFSTTVLRIANSVKFRAGKNEVRNLPMAIQRLGGDQTLQLLIAISSKLHMQVKDKGLKMVLRNVSQHSLKVAVAAQQLAILLRSSAHEEAFLAGLIHDVGVSAVICAIPDELASCAPSDQLQVIQELHREMGGRLLNSWGMPGIFSDVASHHGIESDDRPTEQLIDYIDAAGYMVQRSGHKVLFDAIDVDIPPEKYPPVKRLNITETHLAAVEVELESGLEELQGIFG